MDRIKLFLELMRRGSFAEVARSRNLDPSMVSRTIAQLEGTLGVRLFNRTTRKLAPTEAAVSYAAQIEPLVEEMERVQNSLRETEALPQGVLRISSTVSFGLMYLAPMLPRFLKENPKIQVELLMTDAVVDLVAERIDVTIRFGALEDSTLIAKKLAPLEYLVCSSPSYLKGRKRITKPSDLIEHNCVQFLLPDHGSEWKFDAGTKKEVTVPVRGNLRISSALAIKEAIIRGSGIALMARLLVEDELAAGTLVQILPGCKVNAGEPGANAWVMYPSRSFLPMKTTRFVDFLFGEFSGQA